MLRILINLISIGIFLGVMLIATASNANEPLSREFGRQILLKSQVLGEDRNIIIHLPNTYKNSSKRYPVLYLLDGDRHLYHSVIATELLYKAKKIPELIIVAISNKAGKRQRDLNSEKEKFTDFINNEVAVHIDKNYRTSDSKTLFGHSLAGYYVTDLLATHPESFDNYIAASPPLQGDELAIYNKIVSQRDENSSENKTLYFTLASKDEEGNDVAGAMDNFVSLLKKESPKTLDWNYSSLEGQTHITTSYLTLFHGITYVFNKK